MTKQEFAKITAAINTYYPREKPFPNAAAIQLWYEEFKDQPYEDVVVALRRHVNTSRWCPTIAELKEALVVNVAGQKDWGEHWKAAVDAIRRFGRYREQEALDSLDPLTREVVKRLGYQDLCRSENQMTDRANFRVVFEQVTNNEYNKAALPKDLLDRIAQIGSGEAKRLEEDNGVTRDDAGMD